VNRVLLGDNLELLRALPDASVAMATESSRAPRPTAMNRLRSDSRA
jgi:hypothetical protein